MPYGTPKFFDCDHCEHHVEDGCRVLPLGPPPGPSCAWFNRRTGSPDPVAETERAAIKQAACRRARDLYATFAGGENPLTDLSLSDWQDMVDRLSETIGPGDVRHTIRIIRDFGANGLEVTCGACGETAEIDEDSPSWCPACGQPMAVE